MGPYADPRARCAGACGTDRTPPDGRNRTPRNDELSNANHTSGEGRAPGRAGGGEVPVVLAIGGLDPSGGAGIQADIEAIAAMGCHAAAVVTALTVQDPQRAQGFETVDPALVTRQMRTVLASMPVRACKTGMMGSAAVAHAVRDVLIEHDIPIVVDPVLAAGGGGSLAEDGALEALQEILLPLATLATPNSVEARRLAPGARDLDECAARLLALGARHVLVKGAHEDTPRVVNTLHGPGGATMSWEWERLPDSYHGSGCTLAAAAAGLLGRGAAPVDAVREAQAYTWRALQRALRVGRGQPIPNRWPGGGDA